MIEVLCADMSGKLLIGNNQWKLLHIRESVVGMMKSNLSLILSSVL